MLATKFCALLFLVVLVRLATLAAIAQSFRVQCPASAITHRVAAHNNSESAYNGPTTSTSGAKRISNADDECERHRQVPADLGWRRFRDDGRRHPNPYVLLRTVIGVADMAAGKPGTKFPSVFDTAYTSKRCETAALSTLPKGWRMSGPSLRKCAWAATSGLLMKTVTYHAERGMCPRVSRVSKEAKQS